MRFIINGLILFISVFLLTNCQQTGKKELQTADQTSLDEADSMIILYTEQIRADSSNAPAFRERAHLYEMQNKLLLAISDMEKLIELDPTNTEYLNKLGSLYFRVANRNKAIESYIRTLEVDNTNEEAHLNLGKIYYYLSVQDTTNRNASLVHLYNVVKLNNTNPEAYFFIAQNYLEEGDTTKGINALVKSVDADPDFYEGYIQLGILFAADKNMKAIDYYENALRIIPESAEAHYNLAYFYQSIDSLDLAEEIYRELLLKHSSYKTTNYNLAYILYLKEAYEESIYYFNEAIKKDPADINAYYGRGLCFKNQGKKDQAIRDFSTALEIDPSDELIRKELNKLKE